MDPTRHWYQSFLVHKPLFQADTSAEAMAMGDAYEKGWADGYWRNRHGCAHGPDSMEPDYMQNYHDGFKAAVIRLEKDEAEKKAENDMAKKANTLQKPWDSPVVDHNPVDAPSHYRSHPSGVECIAIAEHMGYNLGNVIKYCWRAGLKSTTPIQDLQKAVWYLKREIDRLERSG